MLNSIKIKGKNLRLIRQRPKVRAKTEKTGNAYRKKGLTGMCDVARLFHLAWRNNSEGSTEHRRCQNWRRKKKITSDNADDFDLMSETESGLRMLVTAIVKPSVKRA